MNKSEFLGLNLPSRDNTTDIADINAISENFETIDDALLDLAEKQIPELQTKENINLNFDDNSTNEEQYPSVPAVVNFTNRKVDPLKIINSASGNVIALKDSANDKLVNLKLFGKTTQNGTPTPDNPIELKSVGDSGSYEVGVYGKNLLDINSCEPISAEKITISGDNIVVSAGSNLYGIRWKGEALPKLEVGKTYTFSCGSLSHLGSSYGFNLVYADGTSSGIFNTLIKTITIPKQITQVSFYFVIGETTTDITISKLQVELGTQATPYEPYTKQSLTFTDTLRGVGGVADEKKFARGVKTEHIYSIIINSMNGVQVETIGGYTRFGVTSTPKAFELGTGMCNRLKVSKNPIRANDEDNCISGYEGGGVYFRCDELANATDQNTWLTEHPIHFIYRLATPIETPLTEQELNAYRQLHTNKPNTTFISEADMEVDYVADPKLYIDNKIAELTALTLEG